MRHYFVLWLLVCCVCTAGAQPLAPVLKNAVRGLPTSAYQAAGVLGERAAQAAARRTGEAAFQSASKQLTGFLEAECSQLYCPTGLPPALQARNIELEKARRQLLQENLRLFFSKPNIAQARFSPRVDYADIIPSSAQLIFLGEIHGHNTIHREIYKVIKDYRARYPSRRIYILAESVADDGIIYQSSNWGAKGPYQKNGLERAQMLKALVKEQNVFLTGLERPGLIRLYNASSQKRAQVVRKYVSSAGLEIRNRGFLDKIALLRQADPEAVLFVYGGKAHWSYAHAGSVPLSLNTNKTFVMDFTPRGWRLPSSMESIWNLWLKSQTPPPAGQYGVYVAKDKPSALILGSDAKIETPDDFLLNWR